MDSSFDVPDPSDWLNTPVSKLAPVEAALRCQVCKDFFDTPMITSCAHTFCSLCIRRCLTSDGKCPACRSSDQEMRLRPNGAVQELVDAFKLARPAVLDLGRELKAIREDAGHSRKRKIGNTDMEDDTVSEKLRLRRMQTRSQDQKGSGSRLKDIDHTQGEDDLDSAHEPDDGLTACPICSKRMKEENVFSHLDVHNVDQASPAKKQLRVNPQSLNNIASRARSSPKSMERLPQMNYSLLKDNALRKKMADLGLPNSGPRTLLIRRHTEWVNLVNANCDSLKPRSKRELLHDLDVWDKTQGRQILNGSNGSGSASSVMNKDFDGAAWAASHNSDFQKLIADARRKGKSKSEEEEVGRVEIGSIANATTPNDQNSGGSNPSDSFEGPVRALHPSDPSILNEPFIDLVADE